MTAMVAPASLRVKLDLPEGVLSAYERQADEYGVTIEEILASRLADCVQHTSVKPLYVTDEERQKLEAALRRNISTVAQLVSEVQKASSINVEGVSVKLSPALRQRLRSRNFSQPFDQFLSTLIVQSLEQYVGLR